VEKGDHPGASMGGKALIDLPIDAPTRWCFQQPVTGGDVTMMDALGKPLRFAAIVLMGMSAALNILGGVGTVCAAFLTENYHSMSALLDYQKLYQGLMTATILTGIAGAWVTMRLARRLPGSYRNAMILLVLGTLLAAIQVGASLALRGKAVPANLKLYANALTLLVFLLIRLPGIWQRIGLEGPLGGEGKGAVSGVAAIVVGFLILTTPLWVGPSHVHEGVNWVHVLRLPLSASGSILILVGGACIGVSLLERHRSPPYVAAHGLGTIR
jgi:hypothetical protein